MLKLQFDLKKVEAGCDEAGRGCLAGPVVAAAVILPKDFSSSRLNDSKKLTENQREYLRPIIEQEALAFAVAFVEPSEIDEINILNASILAMHKALDQLSIRPEFVSVDGNKFKNYNDIDHQTIIKGDGKYMNIAAASVLAKTYRDEYMRKLHDEFPQYLWSKNKGYPTLEHRQVLQANGPTPHHRLSFKVKSQISLNI
jgi:ribonuclease HII